MDNIPFVEKYRPRLIKHMKLEKYNSKIFNHILETNSFPNLLLYGPPGTGKTTTIINLINNYLKSNNITNKGLVMHYNASDDRGIDLIRTTILSFVKSNGLLSNELKFIVLDEVDYMTKVAQIHLKHIIEQNNNNNVRFCLICNYICKIEESLLSEFIIIRFTTLDSSDIFKILQSIVEKEQLDIDSTAINDIILFYKTDIRSMINHLQHNNSISIFNKDTYTEYLLEIKKGSSSLKYYTTTLSYKLNTSVYQVIKSFLTYYIINNSLSTKEMNTAEHIFMYKYDINYALLFLESLCNT